MTTSTLPRVVLIASTVAWLMGGLMALVSIAVAVPVVASGSVSARALLPVVFAVSYCVAGYRLRRGDRSGAVIGMIASGSFIALLFIGAGGPTPAMVAHGIVLWSSYNASRSLPRTSGAADGRLDAAP